MRDVFPEVHNKSNKTRNLFEKNIDDTVALVVYIHLFLRKY